jgi:hypothetical protein
MKFDVGRILDPSVVSKWIWWMGMITRFTFVEGIILNRIIEDGNTQILIFEFEYLQMISNNLGSDATG